MNPEQWLDEYGDALYGFAMARVNDSLVAEDLVQDTLLAGLKSFAKFKGESSLKTWLTGILKHKVMDYYRKSKREVSESQLQSENEDNQYFLDCLFDDTGHRISPVHPIHVSADDNLKNQEIRKFLELCLQQINPKYAQVWIMREIDEMDTDSLCKDTGMTSTHLWVMLHRARNHLQKCLSLYL